MVSIIESVPIEIMGEIVSRIQEADLARLARCNKALYSACIPRLYSRISFCNYYSTVSLCNAIKATSNEKALQYVRHFSHNDNGFRTSRLEEDGYQLAQKISEMGNLRTFIWDTRYGKPPEFLLSVIKYNSNLVTLSVGLKRVEISPSDDINFQMPSLRRIRLRGMRYDANHFLIAYKIFTCSSHLNDIVLECNDCLGFTYSSGLPVYSPKIEDVHKEERVQALLGAPRSFEDLLATAIYNPIAQQKHIRFLSLQGIRLHMELATCFQRESLQTLRIRHCDHWDSLKTRVLNMQLGPRIRSLNIVIHESQLTPVVAMVKSLEPGLETFILMVHGVGDQENSGEGYGHNLVLEEEDITKHSASLRNLSIHDIHGDPEDYLDLNETSIDRCIVPRLRLETLDLRELSIGVEFDWYGDYEHDYSDEEDYVMVCTYELPLDSLQVLRLIPRKWTVYLDTIDSDSSPYPHKTTEAIEKLLEVTFRNVTARPALHRVLLGEPESTEYQVDWHRSLDNSSDGSSGKAYEESLEEECGEEKEPSDGWHWKVKLKRINRSAEWDLRPFAISDASFEYESQIIRPF